MTVCLQDISCSANCLSYADRYPSKPATGETAFMGAGHRSPTRRVMFSDKVSSIETEHVNDISPEEKAKRWLCGEDYFRTKIDLLDHLKIGKHFGWHNSNGHYCCGERTFVNSSGETATITMRGIRSDLESRQRRQDQQETASVVLNEQMLQRSERVSSTTSHSPEIIAMLYHLMSFSNQKQALERGIYDAVCVYGNIEDYQRLGTKHVLLESEQSMDSETMLVDQRILHHLMASENGNGMVSVEDWLFERYQRGQRVAMANRNTENDRDSAALKDVTMAES